MNKHFKILLCLIYIVIASVCHVPALKAKASEKYNLEKLDEYLEKYKDAAPVPGFSVVVTNKDRIIFSKGYGVEVAGENQPMTKDSITKIGTLGQSFTSLAVMQLVEQGRVNLDDPVIKYLPWFKTSDEENSRDITVRMLLSNTSGLPSTDGLIDAPDNSADTMEKTVRSLSSLNLSSKPGDTFECSNEGFDAAGLIIESVSGIEYSDYIEKHILVPLKMDRSTTDVKKFDSFKVLYGHNSGPDGAIPAKRYVDAAHLAAGSEFRSTAEDLGHYLIALLNGGKYEGESIITQDSINEMWTPVITFPTDSWDLSDYSRAQYCLGWRSSFINARTVKEHHGHSATASSYTMIYPDQKIAVAVLFNISSVDKYRHWTIDRLANSIMSIVCGEYVQDIMTPAVNDPSVSDYELPADLKQKYMGDYICQNRSSRLTVYEDEKHGTAAVLNNGGQSSVFKLIFASPSSAYLKNISYTYAVQFETSEQGTMAAMDEEILGSFIKQNYNGPEENKNTWPLPVFIASAVTAAVFVFYVTTRKMGSR